MRTAAWRALVLGLGLGHMALAAEIPASGSPAIPPPPGSEFVRFRTPPDDCEALIRATWNEHFALLTDAPVDTLGILSETDGVAGAVARGLRLGLTTGVAGYTLSNFTRVGEPMRLGLIGLGGGFLAGALDLASGPARFTLTCGDESACRLTFGWQPKPGYLPQSYPAFAGTGTQFGHTAGASLSFGRPQAAVRATFFFDPAADATSTLGGFVLTARF